MATSAPRRPNKHRLTRRGLFTLGGGVAAAGVVGAGIAAFTGDGADAAQTDTTATGMGNCTTGYDVLPTGTQQMWQNEYFYVDGSVTLTVNERGADYGLTRDTGRDNAPVPQHVTRTTPADPATVAQESRV